MEQERSYAQSVTSSLVIFARGKQKISAYGVNRLLCRIGLTLSVGAITLHAGILITVSAYARDVICTLLPIQSSGIGS